MPALAIGTTCCKLTVMLRQCVSQARQTSWGSQARPTSGNDTAERTPKWKRKIRLYSLGARQRGQPSTAVGRAGRASRKQDTTSAGLASKDRLPQLQTQQPWGETSTGVSQARHHGRGARKQVPPSTTTRTLQPWEETSTGVSQARHHRRGVRKQVPPSTTTRTLQPGGTSTGVSQARHHGPSGSQLSPAIHNHEDTTAVG